MPVQQSLGEERTGLSSDNQALQHNLAAETMGENVEAAIATTSTAMVNYGQSNESGQLLARELLARELQARELLAREMGSQTESRKRVAGTAGRSARSRSGNVSLDESSIVSRRSRWTLAEPAAAAVKQQENSSLPAEFLYFKFEQMVARWIKQKTMSTVLSMERYGPRLLLNRNAAAGRGPPRTITTTTTQNEPRNAQNAIATAPALAMAPSHTTSVPSTDDSNVPRFMRNTTTSVGHAVQAATSAPPTASNNNHSRQRSRTSSKTPIVNNRKETSTSARWRPSPSPVRNARRESSSPQQPRNRNTRSRTGINSLRREPQLQKTQASTKKKKEHGQARSTQVSRQQQQQQDETRSPLETTEYKDAQHYFKRETSEENFQEHVYDTNHGIYYQTTLAETRQVAQQQSKPDPEGPTPNTRPDPSGDRWATPPPIRHHQHLNKISASPLQEQLKIPLPPTPRSPSPARTKHFGSPTAAATGHQVAGVKGSPSRAKTPTGVRRNTSTSPTKRRTSPSPRRTPQQTKAPNSAGNSSRRRQSRLPPLPTFKAATGTASSSPSLQQHRKRSSSLGTPNKKQPGNARTKNSPQRGGKRSVTKPDPPKLRQYKRVHFRAIKVLQRFGRMVPDRRRFLTLRSSVVRLQSLLRRKLQIQAFRKAIRGTRLQKFASIVIQKNYRRVACQSSYVQLRHAIVVVQSAIRMFACRSTFIELRSASKKLLGRCPIREAPSTPKPLVATIKGGRLRIYSAMLIQSLVRMRWVQAAFLELRGSAIVLQKWFRKVHKVIKKQNSAAIVIQNWTQMLSWRACFLDLRVSVILLQKWTRQVCARSRYIREKRHEVETASSLVIQRRWRSAACRRAYNQLRSSALILQDWGRSRIRFLRLCRAVLVLQCRVRQLRSERAVHRLRSAVVVKAAYKLFGSTMHVHTSTIQACIRGYLYRTRYLSLRLAAIVAQKRFRGKQACAYVAVRQAALFKETTKQKRSKMNEEKPKPDPMVGNESMYASLLGAPQPGDTLKTIDTRGVGHDGGILSAALANVAQSPSVRSTTPRRFRQASPATNGNYKSFFPTSVVDNGHKLNRAPSPQDRTQPQEANVVNGHSPSNSFIHSFPGAISKNIAAVELSETRKVKTPRSGPRDPAGENMSRKPPPLPFEQNSSSVRGDYSDPKTLAALYMSPPPPPPPQPRPPKQHKVKTSPKAATTAGTQPLRSDPPSNLMPAPDALARMPSVEMSPSRQYPYLMSRPSDKISMELPKVYPLQPFMEASRKQEQPPHNPYLYLAPHSQLMNKFSIGGMIMPQPGPGSKFERKIVEESQLTSKPDSLETPNVPAVPSISDNPRYYLPTKSAKKGLKSTVRETSLVLNVKIPQKSAENAIAPLPTANPLKKILQSRHSDGYLMPKLKKEDDATDKAIGEKLATMKHRSTRSRKVRRSRSALKKDSTMMNIDLKEQAKEQRDSTPNRDSQLQEQAKEQRDSTTNRDSQPNMDYQPKVDMADAGANPMEQWAKETLQTRKNSLFTSVLDDESATLIQSVWRARRDQLRLAGLLLKTWSVSCELQSEDLDDDCAIRRNAHILALDGAFRQLGNDWQACNLLIKKGLTMVQWEGLVPIEFLKLGLARDDTFYTSVSVHCTGVESNILRAWNEDRRCTLLVKAAITKHCGDHKQCSSVFEKSLTSKSTDTASISDPVSSADQLVRTKNAPQGGSPWTDPPDVEEHSSGEDVTVQRDLFGEFQGRVSGSAAILIQSWYRMCVCRRMYQGLRRIQSRALLGRPDDAESNFLDSSRRHTCETIVEEKEGFEVNSSSED